MTSHVLRCLLSSPLWLQVDELLYEIIYSKDEEEQKSNDKFKIVHSAAVFPDRFESVLPETLSETIQTWSRRDRSSLSRIVFRFAGQYVADGLVRRRPRTRRWLFISNRAISPLPACTRWTRHQLIKIPTSSQPRIVYSPDPYSSYTSSLNIRAVESLKSEVDLLLSLFSSFLVFSIIVLLSSARRRRSRCSRIRLLEFLLLEFLRPSRLLVSLHERDQYIFMNPIEYSTE